MDRTKKKQTREEKLEKKRLAEHRRLQKIKNDPQLYEEFKAKDRARYNKKKEQKKVVPMSEMPPHRQRTQRNRNRINFKAYYTRQKNKIKIETLLCQNSPSESNYDLPPQPIAADSRSTSPQPVPTSSDPLSPEPILAKSSPPSPELEPGLQIVALRHQNHFLQIDSPHHYSLCQGAVALKQEAIGAYSSYEVKINQDPAAETAPPPAPSLVPRSLKKKIKQDPTADAAPAPEARQPRRLKKKHHPTSASKFPAANDGSTNIIYVPTPVCTLSYIQQKSAGAPGQASRYRHSLLPSAAASTGEETLTNAAATTTTRLLEPLEEDDLPSRPTTSADASEGAEPRKQNVPIDYVTTVVCPNCNTEMELAKTEEPLGKASTIIAKVYHFLEREYYTLKKRYGDLDLSPLLKISARTAEATGVSEETVSEILKEEHGIMKNPPQVKRAKKRNRYQDVPDEIDRLQDSCGDVASSGKSDDDHLQTENQNREQTEPEMETLVVKVEMPDNENDMEQAGPDSDLLAVHTEPADVHIHVVNSVKKKLFSIHDIDDEENIITNTCKKSEHDQKVYNILMTCKGKKPNLQEKEARQKVEQNDASYEDNQRSTVELLTRKRKRQPDKWKRNIIKKKREAGEEYINIKGEIKQKKIVRSACKATCNYNCSAKISDTEREDIKTLFYTLSDDQKYKYYNEYTEKTQTKRKRTQKENSRRKYSFVYYLPKVNIKERVCKKFFCATLDISIRRIYHFYKKMDTKNAKIMPTPKKGSLKRKTQRNDTGEITIQGEIKKEPEEFTFLESPMEGETSTAEYTTTIIQPNVNEQTESGILERDPIKIEDMEIREEGYS